jgi:hypothetical protein
LVTIQFACAGTPAEGGGTARPLASVKFATILGLKS